MIYLFHSTFRHRQRFHVWSATFPMTQWEWCEGHWDELDSLLSSPLWGKHSMQFIKYSRNHTSVYLMRVENCTNSAGSPLTLMLRSVTLVRIQFRLSESNLLYRKLTPEVRKCWMKNGLTYVDHPTSLDENNPCSLGLYITTISVVYLIRKYSTIHFSHSGVNYIQSIKRCGRNEGTPYFFGDSMCHRFDASGCW